MVKIISDDGRDKIEVEGWCVCVRIWIMCQSKSMLFASQSFRNKEWKGMRFLKE